MWQRQRMFVCILTTQLVVSGDAAATAVSCQLLVVSCHGRGGESAAAAARRRDGGRPEAASRADPPQLLRRQEDGGPGDDGCGAHHCQRQPVALRAGVQRRLPLLLPGRRPHCRQPHTPGQSSFGATH